MDSNLTRVARALDALPFTPPALADRLVDWHIDRREARALEDPRYASIEDLRHHDGTTTTLLDDDLGLDLAAWEAQERIADELTPDPSWLPLARRVGNVSALGALRAVTGFFQRARRGWSDQDVWSLDAVFTKRLGEMMLHLAATAHGWPGTDEFPEYEDWTAALVHHGTVLTTRSNLEAPDLEAASDAWYALETDPSADPAAVEAAREEMTRIEAANHAAITESLRWVADHHAHLWD